MRRPLLIAANISPLALLINFDLSKQRYLEMKIIEVMSLLVELPGSL